MNKQECIAKVRQVVVDLNSVVFNDEEIDRAIEQTLKDYGDKTRQYKDVFSLSGGVTVRNTDISSIWWGVSRNMSYNDIGLAALPPIAGITPEPPGYPPPLITPEESDFEVFSNEVTFTTTYPDTFLQVLFGINEENELIEAQSYRRVHKSDNEQGAVRYIFDDGVTPLQYEVYPQRDLNPLYTVYESDDTFGVIGTVSDMEIEGDFGLIEGGIGLVNSICEYDSLGEIIFIRIPAMDEVQDYMAIVYGACEKILRTRSEYVDDGRAEFFKSLYNSKVYKTNKENAHLVGKRKQAVEY